MVKENLNNFASLDIRVGEIIDVQDFPEAMNPSYVLEINFGENIGIKKQVLKLQITKKNL